MEAGRQPGRPLPGAGWAQGLQHKAEGLRKKLPEQGAEGQDGPEVRAFTPPAPQAQGAPGNW